MAQYGIALFAVAGVVYIVQLVLKNRNDKQNGSNIVEVIKNNTQALQQVTTVVQAIQLSLTRMEAKTDEILERARK